MRAAEKEGLEFFPAQLNRFLIGNHLCIVGHLPSASALQDRFRRRMDEVLHAGGKRGVACRVIAVVGADDDVLNGLRRDLRDGVDQPFGFANAALAVGDEHAAARHHEHVGCRELLGAGVEILVGIDVIGDLDRAREIRLLQSAFRRIGGADDGRLGERQSAERRE